MKKPHSNNIYHTLQAYCVGIAIFFSCILYIPSWENGYILPKVTALATSAVLCLALELIRLIQKKRSSQEFSVSWILLGLMLVNIVAWVFSENRSISFWGAYTQEGLNLIMILVYAVISICYTRFDNSKKKVISYFFVLGTLIASLDGIYNGLIYHTRPSGLEGQPVLSASIIALGLFFCVRLIKNKLFSFRKENILWLAVIAIHLLAIYMFVSSSVMLCIITSYFAAFIIAKRTAIISKNVYRASIVTVFICIIALLIYYVPSKRVSLSQRTLEWVGAVKILTKESISGVQGLKKVVVGRGQSTTQYHYFAVKSVNENHGVEWSWQKFKIRNQYLEILLTTGILGFAVWFAMLFVLLKHAVTTKNIAYLSFALYLLLWQFFYYTQPLVFLALLMLYAETSPSSIKFKIHGAYKFLLFVALLVCGVGIVVSFGKLNLAEYYVAHHDYKRAQLIAPFYPELRWNYAFLLALNIDSYKAVYHCPQSPCDMNYLRRQYETALSKSREAVILDPKQPLYRSLYAAILFKMHISFPDPNNHLLNAAKEQTVITMVLDPKNPEYTDTLGQEYLEEKQYDKALIYFHKALTLKADYIESMNHLKETYKQTGDVKNYEAIDRIIKSQPTSY